MFSRARRRDEAAGDMPDIVLPAPEPVPAVGAKDAALRPKAAKPALGVPSLISADVVLRGVIESDGEVQFDGEIEGDIKAKGLVIGEGARVSGQVLAEKVRVCGTVEGSIRATRVELTAGALVVGDVVHTALAIEAGARFEGNVRHSDDPMGAPADAAMRPAPTPGAPEQPVLEMGAPAPASAPVSPPGIERRAPMRAKADLR